MSEYAMDREYGSISPSEHGRDWSELYQFGLGSGGVQLADGSEPARSASQLFARSDAARPPLRIGVIASDLVLPAVARKILVDIGASNFATIVVLVISVPDARRDAILSQTFLYRAYLRWMERRYAAGPDPLRAVSCVDLLCAVPMVRVQANPPGANSVLPELAEQQLRGCDLDVLLDLTAGGAGWDVASLARHGVWRHYYGGADDPRGVAAYLREPLERRSLSAVELRRTLPDRSERVLCRAMFATSPIASARLNRAAPMWGGEHFIMQKLWELHQLGEQCLAERSGPISDAGEAAVTLRQPGRRRTVRLLVDEAVSRCRQLMLREHWRIALRHSSTPLYDDFSHRALQEFRWIDSPHGCFWADPFLIESNGTTWLFFEEMKHAAGRGHLACGRIVGDGELRDVHVALERPYHLSYPQVFAADGEMFMVPESAQSGAVELYRARSFPDDWVLEARLLEFSCVDTTVFRSQGKWWMFTSPMMVNGHAATTWLLCADQLTGPWRYHPAGPVSNDASVARGAGNVFWRSGQLIRPSQDCNGGYGRALLFNEVQSLDGPQYRERTIARVEAGWKSALVGVHTYNRAGLWEAIDGKFVLPAIALS